MSSIPSAAASAATNAAANAASGSSSSSSSSSSSGSGATNATSAATSIDTFYKLLATQLKYQDPNNPVDPTTWSATLAQYSALDYTKNSNTQLQSISASLATIISELNGTYTKPAATTPAALSASNTSSTPTTSTTA